MDWNITWHTVKAWISANPPWVILIFIVTAIVVWLVLTFVFSLVSSIIKDWWAAKHPTTRRAATPTENRTTTSVVIRPKANGSTHKETERYMELERQRIEAVRKYDEKKAKEAEEAADAEAKALAIKQAKDKAGRDFELEVLHSLGTGFADWLAAGRAKLLFNIRLPMTSPVGQFVAQIDMLLLDSSGIYIIECKNWAGVAVGHFDWPYWLSIKVPFLHGVPKIGTVGQFLNCEVYESPIVQNERHRSQLNIFLGQKLNRTFIQCKQLSVLRCDTGLDFIKQKNSPDDNPRRQYTWYGTLDELQEIIKEYDDAMFQRSRLSQSDINMIYDCLLPFSEELESAIAHALSGLGDRS